MKIKCRKCDKFATWCYLPGNCTNDDYSCDDHVPRGCSCTLNEITGEPILDEKGRMLPCCEFDYYEKGWEEE